MNAASIRLNSVSKSFGPDVHAVQDVSLTIEPGSLVTLLGPSGSGKTTILRSIAGFEDISSGEILIDGESIAATPTHRRQLGMVAQDYALFPHMTVRDNLAFGIRSSRRARRERARLSSGQVSERVDRMLALVGLDGFQARRPQQLSGGQKQRVALARALVTDPRVLLLDEPFAALDKHLREQLQIEVRRIQQEVGITTVFVTHDQGEALSMSDRVAVLNNGRLEQYATPQEVYDEPATRFVAEFVGRINLFDGVVASGDERRMDVALADGSRIAMEGGRVVPAGERVQVSVRPERIHLTPASGQHDDGVNAIMGVVKTVVYLGDRVDVTVNTIVGEIAANVPRDHSGDTEFAVGDHVRIQFAYSAGTMLPDLLSS